MPAATGPKLWSVVAVAALSAAFLVRVAGQAVQRWFPQGFLPPFEAWQGSGIPYPCAAGVPGCHHRPVGRGDLQHGAPGAVIEREGQPVGDDHRMRVFRPYAGALGARLDRPW